MNSALVFLGGIITGALFTLFWSKRSKSSKSKSMENEDVEECQDITDFDYGSNKLILVVRNDLKMGKGKVAAQCSHAAVLAYELARRKCPMIFNDWKRYGQAKIVVKIDSEDEMMQLVKEAKKCQLLVSIVKDAGRTQVISGSKTVLAVGPGPEILVNKVTGHLKLY